MLLVACSDPAEEAMLKESSSSVATARVNPVANTSHNQASVPRENRGTIISVRSAAGYSYLEVDIQGDRFWMATSISRFNPGEGVVWKDYAMMSNFHSKSLGRSFKQIMFVDRVFAESALVSSQHRGTVLEALNAAGYSYIHVRENDKTLWLAAPQTPLSVGQDISWSSGAAMKNFTSQSFERQFDEIFFVNSVAQVS